MGFSDVWERAKKGRKVLFTRDSPALLPLARLIAEHDRRTAVVWALEAVKGPISALSRYFPEDMRFEEARMLSLAWAEGRVKMGFARRAILAAHAAAKETEDPAAAAYCHAVGQACSAVHTPRHAPGRVCYRLTALLSGLPEADWERAIEGELALFLRLADAAEAEADMPRPWAPFLQD